jgi:hypothetical protein
MGDRRLVYALVALVLTGCSAGKDMAGAAPAPTTTVTATATVTETVTADATPGVVDTTPADADPPQLELEVYEDGCGVIRTEAEPGVTYDNLTWSVKDTGGFQVLGRLADGETRYRYFQGGEYTVVLQAWTDGAYRNISNEVTIHC